MNYDDAFGLDDEDYAPDVEQIIEYLASQVCSLDEPWAGPDYHDDHGHTHCFFLGCAIKELREANA